MRHLKQFSVHVSREVKLLAFASLLFFSKVQAQLHSNHLSFPNVAALKQFMAYAPNKAPLISAHRGGPVDGFPENALETFEHTLQDQPIIIETDIALSKDSVLMMMHDDRLNRTSTGTGFIGDFTYEELQGLQLKDNKGNVTPYKIPTLQQVLTWGKGKVIYTLDLKKNVPYSKVIDAIRAAGAESNSIIITYNARQAEEVHQLAPDLMLSVSARSVPDLMRLHDLGIPFENMVAFVGTSAPDSTVYQAFHDRKVRCILGTMGNLDRQAVAQGDSKYQDYILAGADILSTNRVKEAGLAVRANSRQHRSQQKSILVDTTQHINPLTKNSAAAMKRPYVILISADGFRYDYMDKYDAKALKQLSAAGVHAKAMLPAFPTVTFPNHYTLATGLYPSHHGLVNNSVYEPSSKDFYSMGNKAKVAQGKWYGGTPIWVLAEEQQLLSANLFWVGSEAPIKGKQATYWYPFNDRLETTKRIQIVKDWLSLPEERRPHLITFYLSDVDHAGHRYGPDATETKESVLYVADIVKQLTEEVAKTGLPVNFIFVSDHGMTAVNQGLPTPEVIDTAKFIIPASGTMMVLHAKDPADILPTYKKLKATASHYSVYLKKDMPAKYHYSSKDDRFGRIGDILLVPEWPYVFSNRTPGKGYHGFPVEVQDMQAFFAAWGPSFKKGKEIRAFENVDLYPLIATLLGLDITEKIDGNVKAFKGVLVK